MGSSFTLLIVNVIKNSCFSSHQLRGQRAEANTEGRCVVYAPGSPPAKCDVTSTCISVGVGLGLLQTRRPCGVAAVTTLTYNLPFILPYHDRMQRPNSPWSTNPWSWQHISPNCELASEGTRRATCWPVDGAGPRNVISTCISVLSGGAC